ncbi:HAD family hydrolase [Streptomyces cyaneochromogenes]|uniref:HAD family hydrolase n=1 Tax=Streptomyces cyaneochromogenes TaxID=2496836 RepID=A0A3S9M5Y3_9ACTN|nr:HAD-IA family hydrolase [Streptomyces cyaneochromogenes]AZQ34552.1 HAD family hydrolase [Streptomyces cyaneochromogenes]
MTSHTTLSPEALLFDMDGTLVDSTVVVERTWRRFARRHGLDAERILATAHGRRTGETVARYAPAGVDVAAETARLVAEEVEDVDGIVPVPGAPALLASLAGDRWAVVTSAGRELTHRRMAAAGLPLPSLLVSADDVREGKPSPEGYLTAAAALNVRPAATVVFEDAEAGLRAAAAAGAPAVVVGDHGGPAAAGCPKVRDLREVTVTDTGRGVLRLTLKHPEPVSRA